MKNIYFMSLNDSSFIKDYNDITGNNYKKLDELIFSEEIIEKLKLKNNKDYYFMFEYDSDKENIIDMKIMEDIEKLKNTERYKKYEDEELIMLTFCFKYVKEVFYYRSLLYSDSLHWIDFGSWSKFILKIMI